MAYAVIKTGGKQFVVEKGSRVRIPSIDAEAVFRRARKALAWTQDRAWKGRLVRRIRKVLRFKTKTCVATVNLTSQPAREIGHGDISRGRIARIVATDDVHEEGRIARSMPTELARLADEPLDLARG